MNLEVGINGGTEDITGFSGNYNLANSLGTLGSNFSFEVARNSNDSNFEIIENIECGALVRFTNNIEMFSGIIIDIEIDRFKKNIKCLDYSFYLNNNKVIKQYKTISSSQAIKSLCKSIGIECNIADISTKITKIYKNKTIAEIIIDILSICTSESAIEYRMEINGNIINISEYTEIEVKNKNYILGKITRIDSIANMKNKIVVTSNTQDDVSKLYEISDDNYVGKYGSLQEIIEVEPDNDISNVRNIARKELEKLKKINTAITINVLGEDNYRSGRVINIKNELYKVDGKFLIKSCNHTWTNGNHKCSLELEVKE